MTQIMNWASISDKFLSFGSPGWKNCKRNLILSCNSSHQQLRIEIDYLFWHDIAEANATQRNKTEIASGEQVSLKNCRSHDDVTEIKCGGTFEGIRIIGRIKHFTQWWSSMMWLSEQKRYSCHSMTLRTMSIRPFRCHFFHLHCGWTTMDCLWYSFLPPTDFLPENPYFLFTAVFWIGLPPQCHSKRSTRSHSACTLTLSSSSSRAIARIFRLVRYARRLATPGHIRHKHTFA